MSHRQLAPALRAARLRQALVLALLVLPWMGALALVGLRLAGMAGAMAAAAAVAAALGVAMFLRLRRLDAHWAVRRLDERRDLEDSADLLLAAPGSLGPLQQVQRARIEARLAQRPADLRPGWRWRRWVGASAMAGVLALGAWFWPTPGTMPAPPPATAAPAGTGPVAARLVATRLAVAPPAYTGIAPSESDELAVRAPVGSRLDWTLRFEGHVDAVALVLHDGERIELASEDGAWRGSHVLNRSALYRIEVDAPYPPPAGALHRLEAVPDLPPEIRAITPERNLTPHVPGEARWPLHFEARDDHGLGAARLVITLAEGSGEQVTVSERVLPLRGEGDARTRQYRHALDVAAAGLVEGSDLIVRLEVADNRAPDAQWSRSPSFILRWPPPAAVETTGVEGLVQRAIPAYFRSQRQIIIDIEALVPQRPRLAPDAFLSRSDAIGVDQRILRLRYGQFLGEENEPGSAGNPPPTGDHGDAHHEGDGHDHGGQAPAPMGAGVNVLEDFGHTHDDAEAATLLDPETRALLKTALDAMWQSEGELRQGEPARALPHAYRALEFIKQAQNATRIYLARVGLELPPVDETRRLTGKREGIASRADGLVPADDGDSPPLALWRALGDAPAAEDATAAALEEFGGWLAAREGEPDLDLLEAVETLRADPACGDCRQRLRGRLWPLLPPATPAAGARTAPDAAGTAYLEALSPPESTP